MDSKSTFGFIIKRASIFRIERKFERSTIIIIELDPNGPAFQTEW
jgi:hypothetical protein